jgi:hypothetical protein
MGVRMGEHMSHGWRSAEPFPAAGRGQGPAPRAWPYLRGRHAECEGLGEALGWSKELVVEGASATPWVTLCVRGND